MDLIQAMRISSTGLSAHRIKMNVVAENLANAETTRTKEGGPYRRKMVVYEAVPILAFRNAFEQEQESYTAVRVSEIVRSQEDFVLEHNPHHPDADPITGDVAMPNVNHLTEMADMMVARRAYDANVTAISNTKSMILKALEIGK